MLPKPPTPPLVSTVSKVVPFSLEFIDLFVAPSESQLLEVTHSYFKLLREGAVEEEFVPKKVIPHQMACYEVRQGLIKGGIPNHPTFFVKKLQ